MSKYMPTTVISPGDEDGYRRQLTDPPMFSLGCDLQEWRRKNGRWADIVKTAHDNGTDWHFQTVYKILGRSLFEKGLPPGEQALVKEAQKEKIIDYLQVEDLKAALDIVRIVAVDPPIAMATRLIGSFQKVTACRRGRNESLAVFVSRFRGFAAEHLVHSNSSPASQIGELLAVTLLNNANLDDATLSNATSALIARAEGRKAKAIDSSGVKVSHELISKVNHIVGRLSLLEQDREIPRAEEDRKKFMETFRSKCIDFIKQLTSAVVDLKDLPDDQEITVSIEEMFISQQERVNLHLDDAVQVLRSLTKASSAGSSARYTAREVNAVVDKKINAFLASHKKYFKASGNNGGKQPNKNGSRGSQPTQNKKKRKAANNDDSKVQCLDCGDQLHNRGSDDRKSPSFETKMRKKQRTENNRSNDDDDKEKDPQKFFRRGFRDD